MWRKREEDPLDAYDLSIITVTVDEEGTLEVNHDGLDSDTAIGLLMRAAFFLSSDGFEEDE